MKNGCFMLLQTIVCMLAIGLLMNMFEPVVEHWWHKRKMYRQFSNQMSSSRVYEPMSYTDLEKILNPSFTVGDAFQHFGVPRNQSYPYRSGTDYFSFGERFPTKSIDNVGSNLVTSLEIVFTNFRMKEWWPSAIDGVSIRESDGEWSSEGKILRAWEKWPGTKASGISN